MEKYANMTPARYMIEQISLVSYVVSAYASIFNEPPLQIINRVSWLIAMFHNKNNAQAMNSKQPINNSISMINLEWCLLHPAWNRIPVEKLCGFDGFTTLVVFPKQQGTALWKQ